MQSNNPFYVPINHQTGIGNKTHFYIICLANHYVHTPENEKEIALFYQPVDIHLLPFDKLSLLKVPISFVTDNHCLVSVPASVLQKLNSHLVYAETELATLMLQCTKATLKPLVSMYVSYTIQHYIQSKTVVDYYHLSQTGLIQLMNRIESFNWWKTHKRIEFLDMNNECDVVSALKQILTSRLSENEYYYLVCGILSSKDYPTVILQNNDILAKWKSKLDQYPNYYQLYRYAWLTMLLSREVQWFNLENAAQLPVYPFYPNHPETNPYYVPLHPHLTKLSISSTHPESEGICDKTTFNHLFKVYTGNIDIFQFMHSFTIITGDCMAAILPRRNYDTDQWAQYLNDHYKNSKTEIYCYHPDLNEYTEQVQSLTAYLLSLDPHSTSTAKKTLCVKIHKNVLEKVYHTLHTIIPFETLVENPNEESIRLYFYELYLTEKIKRNNVLRVGGAIIHSKILKHCSYKWTRIQLVDYLETADIYSDNIPYVQFNEQLEHWIECDTVRTICIKHMNVHPRGYIETHHCSPTQAYYDNENCYLSATAISAYQTGVDLSITEHLQKNDYHKMVMGNREFSPQSIIDTNGQIIPISQLLIDSFHPKN